MLSAADIKAHSRGLLLLARRNALGLPRFGIALGKRKVRRATMRNRIKRQLRESFRRNHRRLGALDVVALPAASATEMSRREFWRSAQRAWTQLERRGR